MKLKLGHNERISSNSSLFRKPSFKGKLSFWWFGIFSRRWEGMHIFTNTDWVIKDQIPILKLLLVSLFLLNEVNFFMNQNFLYNLLIHEFLNLWVDHVILFSDFFNLFFQTLNIVFIFNWNQRHIVFKNGAWILFAWPRLGAFSN